jgi:hypothetical protein
VDVAGYERSTGVHVDQVLICGLPADKRDTQIARTILKQLDGRYERVFVSPRGLVEIYRRKTDGPP